MGPTRGRRCSSRGGSELQEGGKRRSDEAPNPPGPTWTHLGSTICTQDPPSERHLHPTRTTRVLTWWTGVHFHTLELWWGPSGPGEERQFRSLMAHAADPERQILDASMKRDSPVLPSTLLHSAPLTQPLSSTYIPSWRRRRRRRRRSLEEEEEDAVKLSSVVVEQCSTLSRGWQCGKVVLCAW